MSAAEFAEWGVFYRLDPWGPERDNWHAALVASTAVRVAGGSGARAITAESFMHDPWRSRSNEATDVEATIERFMAGF